MSRSMSKPTKRPVRPATNQIRVFAVFAEEGMGPYVPIMNTRDLELPWVHRSFCWFSHALAHLCFMSRRTTKPTKCPVRPAKTQISMGICPVWSVFAICMKKPWVLSYPMSAQRRFWSDWVDAQTDLSLRWAHRPHCWFCHAAALT